MTKPKENPVEVRYHHGHRCIQERWIDHEELAAFLAKAYDYDEPTEFDYQLAVKLVDWLKDNATQVGQIKFYLASGMIRADIVRQTGISSSRLAVIMEEEGLK